jgi:hypothetical protein
MVLYNSLKVNYVLENKYYLSGNIDFKGNIEFTEKRLKVRTNLVNRAVDGSSMILSGVLLNIGPFQEEFDNGLVYGFFQYKPSYINSFNDLNVIETDLVRLSATKDNSWNFTADNIDVNKDYQYRACVRVQTKEEIYHIHGKIFTVYKPSNLDLSGLELSETFVDARDLTTEAGLVNRGLEKIVDEKVESYNEKEFKHWVWNKLKNIINAEEMDIHYLDYNTMIVDELSSLLAAFSSFTVSDLSEFNRIEIITLLNDEVNELTQEKVDQLSDYELRLLARLFTGCTEGVYRDWITLELKCLLEVILFDFLSFTEFLSVFPFDRWDRITRQKLNITEINNTTIEVEYMETGPFKYMKDFDIGDVIAVEYLGIFTTVSRVVAVEEKYNESGREYKIILGKETKDITRKQKDNVGSRL